MQSNNIIKIEAAGAGKTYSLCESALKVTEKETKIKRVLILSYTNRGIDAIKTEIKKQNMGVLSNKIDVMSWYTFLLGELIKPYQSFLFDINEIKSLDFSEMYGKINYGKRGTKGRYINSHGDIRSNFASELIVYLDSISNSRVINRLQEIYSHIFIDEVQDMAGYDLNIIEILMKSDISVTCVGDNKQATFKTNNSIKNKKMTGTNIWMFFEKMVSEGIAEIKKNLVSRRFNGKICSFANEVYSNENNMSTSMLDVTEHDGVILIAKDDLSEYYNYFLPTVLRYDKKTDTGIYLSYNFGECKGMTFERVIIFPNGSFKDFILKGKVLKSPQKYYVAATRAKYSIAFVLDKLPAENDKWKKGVLNIGEHTIGVLDYVTSV